MITLTKALYDELRQSILRGHLQPGTRLPSTRALAEERGVSRNTVVNAYEQLLAEGYVEARVGSGTCVARSLPDDLLTVWRTGASPVRTGEDHRPHHALSRRGKLLSSHPGRPLSVPRRPHAFESGLPDAAAFPFRTWTRLMARQWRRPSYELLSYGDPAGYRPLREAIAAYVRAARAVRCEAEQVFIVSGSQQALDLTARLLIDPGDVALIEDPGYPGARVALSAAGASLVPLPVDVDGADITRAARAKKARLVFVTPSHQYPLGVTLSLRRRLALIEWANQNGAWIVEDDYDSEFRYRKKPLPSLQGLDAAGRVIYLGTFSKTLFPSLRLGFVVLPPELVEPFRRARSVVDGHSPVSEQAVLAEFIAGGHFARHIRRMRVLYEERQSVLVEAARRDLGGLLDVRPLDGGMHLVGWLPEGVDDVAVAEAAAERGVHVFPLSRCAIGKSQRRGLLLGYAALTPVQIREGVRKLAAALRT
jgi:GntR family transcriptional regulator/MocR family aminotransferase